MAESTDSAPTSMTTDCAIESLSRIRHLVAFLGSRKQFNWWDCSFMDETGLKFLETTFPRSARKAAFAATSEAAQHVHDDALGRKGCFHLFRMPVHIEDRLSNHGFDGKLPTAREDALTALAEITNRHSPPLPIPPTSLTLEVLVTQSDHGLTSRIRKKRPISVRSNS